VFVKLIYAFAYLPIGAITETLVRQSTDSVVHRFADTLETLFARPLIRLIADLPIDANAYSRRNRDAVSEYPRSAISLIDALADSPSGRSQSCADTVTAPAGDENPPRRYARRLTAIRLTSDPPANIGRIRHRIRCRPPRPSGETANGIPLAYPAIHHPTGLATMPEAPMLLQVVRQSNSDHGLIACDPRRRSSMVASPVGWWMLKQAVVVSSRGDRDRRERAPTTCERRDGERSAGEDEYLERMPEA